MSQGLKDLSVSQGLNSLSLQTAMLLLEKSVHGKQDTIVGLRRQLEEVKTANLKMTSQLKVRGCGLLMSF